MKLGVIMDPIENIAIKKDTSFELMITAQRIGWDVYYIKPDDIYAELGEIYANLQGITLWDELPDYFQLQSANVAPLSELDVILMRVDPPVDLRYINLCQLLDIADRKGTLVVNSPRSLRSLNEKLTALTFYNFMPPTLVTNSRAQLEQFMDKHSEVVVKPIQGMGGAGIFLLARRDPNSSVILDMMTADNQILMAQMFLPEVEDGDRRILVIDGEVIPYTLARIPQKDEFRGNLAAGGKGVVMPIQPHEEIIGRRVGKWLAKRGVLFAGLDVIGNYLTEINITSPTCMREIEAETSYGIANTFFDKLASLSHIKRENLKRHQLDMESRKRSKKRGIS